MKWDLNEIKNQVVHFVVSLATTYLFLLLSKHDGFGLLFIGFILGLSVEIWQYFYKDNKELKLLDRIRDIFFYIVGSFFVWIF